MSRKFGIGLRNCYNKHIIKNKPKMDFVEIHGENFFYENQHEFLMKIRENYELSIHCVGLSLGSAEDVDETHLKNLKKLVNKFDPFLVSDHISWSKINGKFYNDLLPIPYNQESLEYICRNISKMQDTLERQILVENPSSYLSYTNSEMNEAEFINKIAKQTGCKILLDVNNIFVSGVNLSEATADYITSLDSIVNEIHLAGHSVREFSDGTSILVDTHDNFVREEVWDLYKTAARKFPDASILVEWDQNFPKFSELYNELKKAKKLDPFQN